ncbi:hypothetical protein HNE05_12370 [Aquipseudomonas campi]|uniref:Uncharacterized protein n=1 Tax=Aquipseudomonas campi TaxID=2731681 RepID=A0A6M8FTF7_9GAMM|nr:hypothetical protein [Pseudomonas campi]QKE64108.1 hypothetical protein HNE05_12370 [Pseudomonas campi]
MRASAIVATGLALLLGSASPMTRGCGYDGMAVDLTTAHPASLSVALAIHDAYQAKLLTKPIALQGGFGMRRAQIMLEKLRVALAPIAMGERFSLLLIEPGLWAHFDGTGAELRVTLHVAAPAADERVVITGEGVLLALVQGKLGADQALQAGLIQMQATLVQRERLTANWSQAFPPYSVVAR